MKKKNQTQRADKWRWSCCFSSPLPPPFCVFVCKRVFSCLEWDPVEDARGPVPSSLALALSLSSSPSLSLFLSLSLSLSAPPSLFRSRSLPHTHTHTPTNKTHTHTHTCTHTRTGSRMSNHIKVTATCGVSTMSRLLKKYRSGLPNISLFCRAHVQKRPAFLQKRPIL